MKHPLVSVIIPTFNRAALLPRALWSVLRQTVEDWEVIVVDDGSTDATPEVVQQFTAEFGGRLVYLRQPNGGSSVARNRGIEASCGRFVSFLDSDDEYSPDKLERQLELFSLRPELGLVYSDFAAIDGEGDFIPSAFDHNCRSAREMATEWVADDLFVCKGDTFSVLLKRYFIATIVGMVRRYVLGMTIRFAEDQSYAEEWLFFLEIVRRYPCGFIDAPLATHHHTSGSVTRTDKMRNAIGAYRIVRAIESTFPALSCEQREILCAQLVKTARQLGFDAARAGRYDVAARFFVEAFLRRKSLRGLKEMLASKFRALRVGSAPMGEHDYFPQHGWGPKP